MDDVSFILLFLGILLIILFISLLLQIILIQYFKDFQKRLIDLANLESTHQLRQNSQEDIASKVEASQKKALDTIIEHHGTIEESLRALCQLYRISEITIASKDGLVVASSYTNAQEDAAKYSYIFNKGGKMDNPGINIFGLTYKLSPMIGIIKSSERIDDETKQSIKENVIKILNYWL